MKREIKFRAWGGDRMQYNPPVMSLDGFMGLNTEIRGWENIMQYTGLKDKNGREIYEGDIIQFNWGEESKEGVVNSLVEFSRGMFVYNPMKSKQVIRGSKWDQPHDWCESRWFCGQSYPLCSGFYGYGSCEEYLSNKCKIEVIGNIYETPELIRDK